MPGSDIQRTPTNPGGRSEGRSRRLLRDRDFNQAIQRIARWAVGLPIAITRSGRSAPYRFVSTRNKPAHSIPGSVVISLSAMWSSAASQKRLTSSAFLNWERRD